MEYRAIECRFEDDVCFLRLSRPEGNYSINHRMLDECSHVVEICSERAKVIVLEGSSELFCIGADFQALVGEPQRVAQSHPAPECMYNLWLRLATGPFITVAHVRGRAQAGGVGFVAACDLVLADDSAQFSLSELLFGLIPACVLPFLIRRIGFQRAHSLTLLSNSIGAEEAVRIGLADMHAADSDETLRKLLLRLKRVNKIAVQRYKRYMNGLDASLESARDRALAANHEVFSDPINISKIDRYLKTGRFPWED